MTAPGWRIVLAALVAVVGLLVSPATAAADEPLPDCPDGTYVYVVEQGSLVTQGCSEGETAMARLLELTTVQTVGQGFVCQLDGRPERCESPAGGDAPYWSYWWWRDGEWAYATIGASHRGEPGSIEAWHYAPGEPPPFAAGQGGSAETSQPPAPASPEPDEGGLPGWAPTAITIGVLGVAGLGYAGWQRSRKGRDQP
ncbi:MAG: hypothetical protein ACOX61_10815 [Brooklawnia sp.]|jgi:hypothetical protein